MKKYLFIALVAFLAVTSASAQLRIKMGKNSPIEKLGRAEIAITNLYVDSVDENKLVEDAIRGMLEKLDPHSSYATAKETKAMNEPLNGSFDGIGVQFNMVDDTLLVIQPVTNGPSEKVGIIAGDRIVAVNDTAISGVKMSKEEIMKRLRGPKGTTVNLTIVRRGIKDKLIFKVKRDKIPVTTMDAAYMIRPGIGYIRLGSFGLTSHKEVTIAMDSLKKKGMKDLIFDLEDNGGGYLQAAAQIANEFLQKGDLIVYTSGRAAPRQEYKAQANGRWRNGKVVVLTNEFTASAAEIVSGAIQDQDRGVVVGRRTFGKGLVQTTMDLPYNGQVKLTTAKYFIPSGRCVQALNYKHDKGGYVEHVPDSLTKVFYTAGGREVRDGGGVKPDVEVKPDSLPNIAFYLAGARDSNEVMLNYEVDYIAKHPAIAPAKEFSLTDADYDEFKTRVLKANFQYDRETEKYLKDLEKLAKFEGYYDDAKAEFEALKKKLSHNVAKDLDYNKDYIKHLLENDIVSAYYFQRGAIQNSMRYDKQIKEAVKLLNSPSEYEKILHPVKK